MRPTLRELCVFLAFGACKSGTDRAPKAPQPPSATTLERRSNTSTITRTSGGPTRTELGYGIVLNKGSALQREWITVRDSVMPMDFVEPSGVTTKYQSRGEFTSGGYRYAAKYRLLARDSIAAFEVRCSLFDMWGDPKRTLSHTEVEDLSPGQTQQYTPEWELYSENEASEYYASLCFVARVRTRHGRVVAANMDPILAEAEKFSSRFTPANLEPAAPLPGGRATP